MPADPTPSTDPPGRATLIHTLVRKDTVANVHVDERDYIRADYSDGTDAVIGEVRGTEILSMVTAMQGEPKRPLGGGGDTGE